MYNEKWAYKFSAELSKALEFRVIVFEKQLLHQSFPKWSMTDTLRAMSRKRGKRGII